MNELEKIATFKKELAIAQTFEEIGLHDSAATAMAEFAKKQKLSYDKQNELGRFRIDIENKKGKWLDEKFPHKGKGINEYSAKVPKENLSKMPATKKESARARVIAKEPDIVEEVMEAIEERGEVITPKKVEKEVRAKKKSIVKEQKKAEYTERIETVSDNEYSIDIFDTKETFRVIYADPAWSYNDKQDTDKLGGAAKHYDTMSISELSALPVKNIAEKDSVLFLWVTSPLLEDAFKVINSWGFKYKTSFIWDKVKHNMGHYNSVRHEILLVCTKGSCTPDNKKLYDSVQSIERNDKHSEKPIEFLDIIDDLYNYGNKLEMFCREIKKDKWYGWGNEI